MFTQSCMAKHIKKAEFEHNAFFFFLCKLKPIHINISFWSETENVPVKLFLSFNAGCITKRKPNISKIIFFSLLKEKKEKHI